MSHPRILNNYLTPSLVVGTLLSIATAIGLLIFDVTDFGVSFIIGLSGMSLAAILDLIDRSEYVSLFKAPAWLRAELATFGEISHKIAEMRINVLDEELHAIFTTAVRDAEAIAQGRLERDGTDPRHLLSLVSSATSRIAAITNIADASGSSRLEWWDGDFGKRYWKANLDAIQRGVTIDRVFIYDVLDTRLTEFVRAQCRDGVNAYLIQAGKVSPSHRTNLASFDEFCAWEARMDAVGQTTGNSYFYNRIDIMKRISQVDSVLVNAEPGQPDPIP